MEIFGEKIKSNHTSLFVLSDIHEGNSLYNEEAFKQAISLIEITAQTRTVQVLLNGDLIDCIEVSDKRFNPVEISEKYRLKDLKDLPRKQADRIIELLEPIKNYIKYSVVGNHEESYIREHHFDVYDYYCHELECKKLGYFGIVRYSFIPEHENRPHFSIDVAYSHGRGGSGGKTIGYPLNWTVDIFEKFNVDIGIAGHRHALITNARPSLVVTGNLKLKKKMRWYCVAGCFLETYAEGTSGYFEGGQGQVSGIGCLEIQIDRVSSKGKNGEYVYDVIERRF